MLRFCRKRKDKSAKTPSDLADGPPDGGEPQSVSAQVPGDAADAGKTGSTATESSADAKLAKADVELPPGGASQEPPVSHEPLQPSPPASHDPQPSDPFIPLQPSAPVAAATVASPPAPTSVATLPPPGPPPPERKPTFMPGAMPAPKKPAQKPFAMRFISEESMLLKARKMRPTARWKRAAAKSDSSFAWGAALRGAKAKQSGAGSLPFGKTRQV